MKAILIQNTWTKKERLYPEIFTDSESLELALERLKSSCSRTNNIPNNKFEVIDLIGKAYALIV